MIEIELFRNKEIKRKTAIHIVITLIFCAVCAVFSLPAAALCLIMGMILLLPGIYYDKKRYSDIAMLCDDIDRLLHGEDNLSFSQYREGELSILCSEISKLTVRLREQNLYLCDEKLRLCTSLADISHQLRTPLTSMNLIVSILTERELSRREQIKYLHDLTDILKKTQWLIDVLLKLSQLDAGVIDMHRERIGCAELIKDSLKPLEITAELKDVAFEIDIEGNAGFTGDSKWSCEALENVLKNSIDHAPCGSRIFIHAEENPLNTQLTVRDEGEGISAADMPHIFDRFYRSGSSGFGIGLAFARRIMIEQDGSIIAYNHSDGGAEFKIVINKTYC